MNSHVEYSARQLQMAEEMMTVAQSQRGHDFVVSKLGCNRPACDTDDPTRLSSWIHGTLHVLVGEVSPSHLTGSTRFLS